MPYVGPDTGGRGEEENLKESPAYGPDKDHGPHIGPCPLYALCVLAGRFPIDIKAKMWREVFVEKEKDRGNPLINESKKLLAIREVAHRKIALEKATVEWQKIWEEVGGNLLDESANPLGGDIHDGETEGSNR